MTPRTIAFAVLAVGQSVTAGCTEPRQGELAVAPTRSIAGLPYHFPRDQVAGLMNKPGSPAFVRLGTSEDDMLLILDQKRDRLQQLRDYKIVASLNDLHPEYESRNLDGEEVICIDTPHFNCGFLVNDQGIEWSVVFDEANASAVKEMKVRALQKISSFRNVRPHRPETA
jgi:hypothetical protein